LYLLHDNAPAISSGFVSEFLAKQGIPMSFHPPYSPDLAPTDILFPKLKIAMKGTRFEAVSSVQGTVTRELKAIREEACSRAFDSLYERCNLVRNRAGTILSDGINKYFDVWLSMASVRELNCHNVYNGKKECMAFFLQSKINMI
jgi:hypothetical protein